MDFLKKNWAKLTLAVISFAGAILMLVPICMAGTFKIWGGFQLIGPMLFFIGTGTYLVLKMINDKTKAIGKFVLVATGLLVTLVMGLGLIGFSTGLDNKGEAKAQGAMGTSYVEYKSAQDQIGTLVTAVEGLKTTLGGDKTLTEAQTMLSSNPVAASMLGMAMGLSKVTDMSAKLSDVVNGLEKVKKDAQAAEFAILFSYLAMMISFGLIPLIRGSKKIVCTYLCKDCECAA